MKNRNFFLFLIILLFVSCKNGMLPENSGNNQNQIEENNEIYLSVQINSPASESSARTASVAVPENVSYKVEAVKDSSYFEVSTPDEENYYLLGLNEDGLWTVTVKGFYENNQIFAGENTVKVTGNGKYYVTVNVYFLEDETMGKGAVNLNMDVSSTTVSKLVVADADNLCGTYYVSDGNIVLNKASVMPGSYNALFSFYDSNDALLVRFREAITVKTNMTTNKWIKSKASIYLVSDEESGEAAFVLTPEVIANIAAAQFYVNSSGSDDGTGNISSPFASLQAAVNRCFALNDIDSTNNVFTIYVDGAVGASDSVTKILQKNYKNPIVLSITGDNKDAEILGSIDAENTNLLIQNISIGSNFISKNCDAVLENVTVGEGILLSDKEIVLKGSTKIGTDICFETENLFIKAEQLSEAKTAEISFAASVAESYKRNSVILKKDSTALTTDDIRRFDLISDEYVLAFDSQTGEGILQYTDGTIFELPLYKVSIELSENSFQISEELEDKKTDVNLEVIAKITDYPESYTPKITAITLNLFCGSCEIDINQSDFEKTENAYEWKKTLTAAALANGKYKLLISVETDSGIYSTSKIINVEEV